MKHIFKKLHLGNSNTTTTTTAAVHDSNRSTESSSPSLFASCTTSSTLSPTTPTTTTTAVSAFSAGSAATDRSDYYSSEEEFQLQLALAISASNSDFRDDPETDQIRAATLLSLGRGQIGSRNQWNEAAESLSRRYWDYNVLDYMEKLVDGFYDIYGLQAGPASQGKMPSLGDIQTDIGNPMFEVVMVNRAVDPALVELEQVAHCIALDCRSTNVELLVQRLADLVTEHMGGPVKDDNIMLVRWMERIMELRNSLHTCVLPVGSLNVGLSRHRALLFKVLADNAGVPCRLVKGSHYTGIEDAAVNIVKLDNEREFLVDLMAAPGTLIPADILSTNENSLNFINPWLNATATSWTSNVQDFDPLRPETSHEKYGGVYRKSVIDNDILLDMKSSSGGTDSLPSVSSSHRRLLPSAPGNSSNESIDSVISFNQPHDLISSKYKGSQDTPRVGDGVKDGHNAPYAQDNTLFAELNPFPIVAEGKAFVKSNPMENKDYDFRRWQGKLASGPGRPPLPLAWNKRTAYNEVPRTKQYGFVEEPSRRNNQGNNGSVASSSSSPFQKLYSNVNVSGDSSGRGDSELPSSTNQLNELGLDRNGKRDRVRISAQVPDKEHQYKNENTLQNDTADAKDHGKNVSNKPNGWKYSNDGVKGVGVMLGRIGYSSSTGVSRHSKIDPMPDDVAELEIPWEDLAIGERIGLGSYGEVYHAEWNGMEVAVKKFLDQDFSGDALDEFRSEVRIMRRLRHPNVVLFVGAVTRPPNLSIVTEFLPRGSLYRILHRPNCQLDENRRIKMALDVAKGMNCLHTSVPTIVHRDLKSLNLLVDNNWNVKVCDFGLSRLKHNTFLSSKSTAGTPEWMAPEVLRNEPSNEKCDVFSFGVILWELATLRLPWTGMNQMQVVGAVGFQNRRLDIPKELDPLVATIIRECWQNDPNLRPSFAQLATALEPLQRLVISSHSDQQIMHLPQEISVNSTP